MKTLLQLSCERLADVLRSNTPMTTKWQLGNEDVSFVLGRHESKFDCRAWSKTGLPFSDRRRLCSALHCDCLEEKCVQLRSNETHHVSYRAVRNCQAKLAALAKQGWQKTQFVAVSRDMRDLSVCDDNSTVFINLAQEDTSTIPKGLYNVTHVKGEFWAARDQHQVQLRTSTSGFANIWFTQIDGVDMVATSSRYVLACGVKQPNGMLWRCNGATPIVEDISTLGHMDRGAISPNSTFIAFSDHREVRYALLQNMEAIDLTRVDDRITPDGLTISADSSLIVAFSDHLIEIWDLNRPKTPISCEIGDRYGPLYEDVKDAVFSPDPQASQLLVGTTAGKLYFINCSTGNIEREIILDDHIRKLAWSSDGRFIIVGAQHGYRVLDMSKKNPEKLKPPKIIKTSAAMKRKRK